MTPLLTRIDQQLATCDDPLVRGELMAEKACYLARIGEIDQAKEILRDLRGSFGSGLMPRISVWMLLTEGISLFFDNLNPNALDRIFRSSVVAQAIDARDLSALTLAWLAHLEFNKSAFPRMVDAIRRSIDCGDANLPTKIRLLQVLADANLHAGRLDISKKYYESCRLAAVSYGDEAAIASLMYNRAALMLNLVRAGEASGQVNQAALEFLDLYLASAYSFHEAAGHRSLPHLLRVAAGRMKLARGEYLEAAEIFGTILGQATTIGSDAGSSILALEHCFCLLNIGAADQAMPILNRIASREIPSLHPVDEVLMREDLQQKIAQILGKDEQARQLEHRLIGLRTDYVREMNSLGALLDEFLPLLREDVA